MGGWESVLELDKLPTLLAPCNRSPYHGAMPDDTFRLWVSGCSHVGTDLRRAGRESLAEAIRQAENGGHEGGPPFDWDIALHLGDTSGSQTPPDDEEGLEVVRILAAASEYRLLLSLEFHTLLSFYS